MKRRVAAFFIFMGLFTLAYQAGAISEIPESDVELILDAFEELITDIDAFGIFTHNTMLAMIMFVPGLGAAFGLFSAWSTGAVFAALVQTAPELASVPPLAILYLTPFGIMELASYSLATSRSALLAIAITTKACIRIQLRPTLIEACIVLGLLLVGGFVEFYMIENIDVIPPAFI